MRKGTPYYPDTKKQQRSGQIKNTESEPTDELPKRRDRNSHQKAEASQVPPEPDKFQKFINFFSNWGILAIIAPILAWGIYIQYDVLSLKQDVEKNQTQIKESTSKIIEIDKGQVGYEKELSFLKQIHQSYENRVSSVENIVKKIELDHALQNSGKRKK